MVVPTERENSLTARMEALHSLSKPVHAKEQRNGPPSADQGLSTASPEAAMLPGPSVETRQIIDTSRSLNLLQEYW